MPFSPEIPYSKACDNNKDPILEHLTRHLTQPGKLLELGSGTGQHAVYFSSALPHITWQTSDRAINHAGINAWIDQCGPTNVRPPIALDIYEDALPNDIDYMFTANTFHIIAWAGVCLLLEKAGAALPAKGKLMVYGPFNYDGQFTSDSNAQFDAHLKSQNPEQGIRDIEAVCAQAKAHGLALIEDNAMPANNRLLVFRRA